MLALYKVFEQARMRRRYVTRLPRLRIFLALIALGWLTACGGTNAINGPTCDALETSGLSVTTEDTQRAIQSSSEMNVMRSDIADVMSGPPIASPRTSITAPKNILAISTGGQNGAFSSGFLAGWSARGGRPVFDIVTGASAGALVAPVAFLGENFDPLLRRNTGIDNRDIFRRRGTIPALFSTSLFDTSPFQRRVEELYDNTEFWNALTEQTTENRLLLIGATDVETGRFRRFDFARLLLADKSVEDKKKCLVEATLASAAIPGLFPPRRINGSLFVDAGVRQSIFLDEIIEELDRSRSRADVYLLINSTLTFAASDVETSLLPLIDRNLEILTDEGMRASILRVLDRAQFRGWTLRAAAITEMPNCAQEDGRNEPVFSACVTEKLYEQGRALALSEDPWLSASELRDALEEGRTVN
ncbi:MAG: patatin-like phospholipase family protein [Pseudomonadota bacterium]